MAERIKCAVCGANGYWAEGMLVCRSCYDDQLRRKRVGQEKTEGRIAALRAENERLRKLLNILRGFDWDTHIGEAGGSPWHPDYDWDIFMEEVRTALEGMNDE